MLKTYYTTSIYGFYNSNKFIKCNHYIDLNKSRFGSSLPKGWVI